MLQAFSDRIRNSRWLGYVIVGLISVPFALWGIQSYLGGPASNAAAEVNGTPIPVYQIQRMAAQQRQQLRQRLGGSLPEGLADRIFLQRALAEAIDRELLRQAAVEADFQVTDETLRRNIRQQEMFRRDGEFNPELYRALLAQSGLTASQYEADVRGGYAIQQLQQGIAGGGFVLPGEARRAARLLREERQLALLTHPRAAAAEAVAVDPASVEQYYEDHQERFQRPRQVRVDYLELDIEQLASQVELSEEDLRAEYRGNLARYQGPEERKAAHILLEVDPSAGKEAESETLAQARELRARLEAGENFAQLAREHSDDPGSAGQGGDLGYVGRGTMVDAFERALFSLEKEGSVSEPVRSPYGYHLVKLLDVRESDGGSFEQVRDEIAADLRARRAERLFYDRVEVLRNSAYEQPGSLAPAADATGIAVETSDWFSREDGDGIAARAIVRGAAFASEVRVEGLNSDLIELGPRRVLVLRVSDERPPEPRPFDEVRAEAREQLRAERVDARLQRWVEETLARLERGDEPASLADVAVTLQRPGWIARGQDSGDLDAAIRREAFALPAPGAGPVHGAVVLSSGDRAVVIVEDARLPEVEPAVVTQTARGLAQQRVGAELQAYVAALQERAEIVRNEQALESR